jgi:orotate phosphoribosyltransferase
MCAALARYSSGCSRLRLAGGKLKPFEATTVISPAIGGIIVGQGVPGISAKAHLCRKGRFGSSCARRGFTIAASESFLVAGGCRYSWRTSAETIQIVENHGGIVAAAGSIVDRSGGSLPDFGCRSSPSFRWMLRPLHRTSCLRISRRFLQSSPEANSTRALPWRLFAVAGTAARLT